MMMMMFKNIFRCIKVSLWVMSASGTADCQKYRAIISSQVVLELTGITKLTSLNKDTP